MRHFLIFIIAIGIFHDSAQARVDLVEENNGRLLVDVRFDVPGGDVLTLAIPGYPPLRYTRVFVAIPPHGDFSIDVFAGDPHSTAPPPRPLPKDDRWPKNPTTPGRNGFYPSEPVVVSRPMTFRKTRVVAIDCFESQVNYASNTHRVWKGYRLEIRSARMAKSIRAEFADPILRSLVLNKKFLPVGADPAAGAAARRPVPDPHFDQSSNWVRVRIATPGVYEIRGSDLAAAGVNIQSIGDPSSFRLFTAGGREQKRVDANGKSFGGDTDGTWIPGKWGFECDIRVDYGGDGSFDPGDRVLFYGLPADGWTDMYDPPAARDEHFEHLRTSENFYFLTWDDNFAGAPGRMASQNATPGGADPEQTTFEERFYFERDRVRNFGFGDDGWLWEDITRRTGTQTLALQTFTVRDLDTSQPQTFKTLAMSPYCLSQKCQNLNLNKNHHAIYYINGQFVTEAFWDTPLFGDFRDATPVAVTAPGVVREGNNSLTLEIPRDTNLEDFMYFTWFKIFYHRFLRAVGNELLCSSPVGGAVNMNVSDLSTSGPAFVFDVTDQYHPVQLTAVEENVGGGTRQVRFSSGGGQRYFWVGTNAAVKKPAAVQRYFPKDLRNIAASPHMLVVTPPSFVAVAQRYKQYREQRFPFVANPRIEVVTTQEVFDNFSGGLPDPMAIRNYCKFLYDNFTDGNGAPVLTYMLLFGDANSDFKNLSTTQPDFVTTQVNYEPHVEDAYATDDWFVLLDSDGAPGGADSTAKNIIDVAVGRLPAASVAEANFLVNKVIDYETNAEFGPWRARAILVADDEISPSNQTQSTFTIQTENISNAFLASYLDAHKIYLTEFPAILGVKPQSRLEFLDEWNKGAQLINYVGHGSSVQMADEQVFLASDVGNLRNGLRLPLFLAVSCTIGDFATAPAKSLSEKLLLKANGGVIATVTASQVTFIGPNATFDKNVFLEMHPRTQGAPVPLGTTVLLSKSKSLMQSIGDLQTIEENNQKYNLLGDPAMQLLSPGRAVGFEREDVDSLVTGKRQTIRGMVYDAGGQLDTGFSGNVHLQLREPDDLSGYTRALTDTTQLVIFYRYPGGTIYEGTADVTGGRFEYSFNIPRFAETGPLGFVKAYAENGSFDAATLFDSIYFVSPSEGDSTALQPIDGAPTVKLGFKSGLKTVKTGEVLQARVVDADGINTLSTTPEGKIALVFDNTNLPVDVTKFFSFDHGGVDTAGTLEFPLPDLSLGEHRVVFKVSDSFGQISLDTLNFAVTGELDFTAEVVFNYPNPFQTATHFLVKLNHPARIRLDIFTVSGKRVRQIEETRDLGEAYVLWDGRDSVGDLIGNGTYLYVATIDFVGVERPPVVLRGKVVKIN